MKRILLIIIIIIGLISSGVNAQSPELINYQTIVRDASGNVLENQDISFLISITQESESGIVVYSEKHFVKTNQFGLINLQIGSGEVESGSLPSVNWGSNSHFLKVEMDPSGGSSFTLMGTVQLLSVPYALHAKTVENDNVNDADADASNELQTISISGTVLTLSKGGGSVTLPSSGNGGDNWGTQTVVTDATISGEGTTANPLSVNGDLTDDQTLSILGNELSITEGNSVTLPATGDNWGVQFAYTNPTLAGDGLLSDPLKIARQEATTGQVLGWDGTTWKPKDDATSDADNDASNELQTISISGTVLTLSNNGGSVTLPTSGSGGDNWGTQTVIADATLTGEGTSADPLSVNGDL
ncbi:MAG: hypothetical protein JXR31_13535, partial [Prolixibacteraceae bacterium]|nr:hypothetical protein [Prolixibacteraceae bacterium]